MRLALEEVKAFYAFVVEQEWSGNTGLLGASTWIPAVRSMCALWTKSAGCSRQLLSQLQQARHAKQDQRNRAISSAIRLCYLGFDRLSVPLFIPQFLDLALRRAIANQLRSAACFSSWAPLSPVWQQLNFNRASTTQRFLRYREAMLLSPDVLRGSNVVLLHFYILVTGQVVGAPDLGPF